MDVIICTVDTQGTCVLPYFLSIKLVEHSFYLLTFQEIFSSSNEHLGGKFLLITAWTGKHSELYSREPYFAYYFVHLTSLTHT